MNESAARHVVRYQLTWPEYWRSHEICWRAATGRLFLRLVPATGLIAILTGFVLVFIDGPADFAPYFWVFGAAFLGTKAARWHGARRNYRRRADGAVVEVAWDEAGISISEGETPTRSVPWESARVALLTSEGFLIEMKEGAGIWLPFSGFTKAEEIDGFEAEIRERSIPILNRSTVG